MRKFKTMLLFQPIVQDENHTIENMIALDKKNVNCTSGRTSALKNFYISQCARQEGSQKNSNECREFLNYFLDVESKCAKGPSSSM